MKPKDINKKKQEPQTQPRKTNKVSTQPRSNKWVWFVMAAIVIVTYNLYSKAIHYSFLLNWDDNHYISENKDIVALHWANIKTIFTSFYVGNYQPITMLMYAIEYKFAGTATALYHVDNIIIHLINTCLVFVLIKLIAPKHTITALITAAFFAIHPMHIESVAWVAERKDVLYSFFFLLALITYVKYLSNNNIFYVIYTGVFFVLSCLSKPAAVVFPLVMILLDYYHNRKFTIMVLLEKLPFIAVALCLGCVAIHSQQVAILYQPPNISIIKHIAIISYSFISYICKAFVPVYQAAIYAYPTQLGSTLPLLYYLSIATVCGLLFLVWYSKKWGKDGIFGFLFFVSTIVLVLQFLPVGSATMADRYTYLPYIGIFFVVGTLIEYLITISAANKKAILLVCVGLFIVFTIISYDRIVVWENDETLFTDGIQKYPYCSTCYFNRGSYYLNYCAGSLYANDNAKRQLYYSMAIGDFEQTVYYTFQWLEKSKAYSNMGYARCCLGDYTHAIGNFDKSIAIDSSEASYKNRGNANMMLHNYAAAITDYDKAIKMNPNEAVLYVNKGIVELSTSDYQGVIRDANKAITLEPTSGSGYEIKGNAEYMLKDYNDALRDFNKALEINPRDELALKNKDIITAALEHHDR